MGQLAVLGSGAARDAATARLPARPAAGRLSRGASRGASRPGRLDRYARLAVAAAWAALEDAGVDPGSWEGDRVGVVLGSALGCYETNLAFRDSLAAGEPSPRLFAATLPSTPVGEIAIALGARGPQLALAQGLCAELAALALGGSWLRAGRADLVLAGVSEALPEPLRALYPGAPADGATFWLLARAGEGRRGRLLGAGAAFGPDAAARARAAACRDAALSEPPPIGTELRSALGGGRPVRIEACDLLGGARCLLVS